MILHALLFFFLLTNPAFLFKMNIVQIGGIRMNTVVTSKEIILEASKKLIREEGLNSINIRSVASACGVSVGSIYNYFDSKSELVAATVESIWSEIFHNSGQPFVCCSFVEYIEWLFENLKKGYQKYPGFFASCIR